MDDWLAAACETLARETGLSPAEFEIDPATAATLLDLAGIAAHESGTRSNAPLFCYLVGVAARRASVEQIAAAFR